MGSRLTSYELEMCSRLGAEPSLTPMWPVSTPTSNESWPSDATTTGGLLDARFDGGGRNPVRMAYGPCGAGTSRLPDHVA